MKKICIMLVLLLALTIGTSSTLAESYRLGPRDVLGISVWGFEELQLAELVVRDDGKIAFPLIGEVEVAGQTPGEVTQSITTRISEYITNPIVTVNVIKMRTTRVYVLGEVPRPGMYELEKQHNLLDAIGAAGGYTEKAAKRKIYIVQKENMDKPVKVDLLRLLKQGDMSQNRTLSEGDVVFVTNNHKINVERDIVSIVRALWYVTNANQD